jgi:hypothetical protein
MITRIAGALSLLRRVRQTPTTRRKFLAFAGITGGLVVLGKGDRSQALEVNGNKVLMNCSDRVLTNTTIADYRTRAAGSSGWDSSLTIPGYSNDHGLNIPEQTLDGRSIEIDGVTYFAPGNTSNIYSQVTQSGSNWCIHNPRGSNPSNSGNVR